MKSTLKLPFAGNRGWINAYYGAQSTSSYYWSSTPYSAYAYTLTFDASTIGPALNYYRGLGFSLRCLKN